MPCQKRLRPSPAVDSAEADLDDAALRRSYARRSTGEVKRQPLRHELRELCLPRVAHADISSFSVGVVTLFSALALNYYTKNGPTLSEVAQSCLDIKCGYSTPPPPPALSKSQKPGVGEAKDLRNEAL